jgi:hypothetical protein
MRFYSALLRFPIVAAVPCAVGRCSREGSIGGRKGDKTHDEM